MNAQRQLWRRVVAACAWIVLGALSALPVAAQSEPLSARAFEVRYRDISDVAELVGPLLSPQGTLTLRPRLKTLVVEDHKQVLDRVGGLIEGFDLPPRNLEVTLSLFLGTDRREASTERGATRTGFSREVRGVVETLGDFTKWSSYDPLGSRSVTCVEGERVVTSLSEDYRVSFTVDRVHEAQGVVRFRRLSLERMTDDAGSRRAEELYTTGMVLAIGRLHVVGAASGPDSKRALFLTLQAERR